MRREEIEIGQRYRCWLHDRETVVEAIHVSLCAVTTKMSKIDNVDAPSPGGAYDYDVEVRICDGPQTGETASVKSGDLKPLT